ncbi:MAG: hypothetical protein A2158_00475 [Chloroflexi bacterium RBG_13_46_14]|nr:MAG: hypothetical protein A2158_00475 [Chloroflexi bacterium RBG_13_46_14]
MYSTKSSLVIIFLYQINNTTEVPGISIFRTLDYGILLGLYSGRGTLITDSYREDEIQALIAMIYFRHIY